MIKIWRGIEKEGIGKKSEILTLFVCSDVELDVNLVLDILKNNDLIKSVYLGAGRIPFNGFIDDGYKKLIDYTLDNDIKVIVEVSPIYLLEFYANYNSSNVLFICTYYNVPYKNFKNLYFKTDDFEVTRIFTISKEVDITSVEDNRYKDDVLIYEEV